MNACAYVRVSSRSQSVATQRDAIERAAAARGDVVVEWYSETMSGKRLDRPELRRLLNEARGGGVQRLYVYRIDRFCRSGIRDMFRVITELRECGCDVVTVADGFSLSAAGSDIVIAVLAWAAEMERTAIGERVSAARQRVEASGGHWGRPRTAGKVVERQIREMSAKNASQRQIERELGVSRSTIRRVLRGKGPYAADAPATTADRT